MKLSIIIVSFNTKDSLVRCLASIPEGVETIVIDNASDDGSKEYLKEKNIIPIFNKENRGFATACNQGALYASGEILFFLNSDAILEKKTLPKIEAAFVDNLNLGIAAPQILTPSSEPQTLAYGSFPTLSNTLVSRREKRIDWVSGAALAIRKDLFIALKGFDEKFFMYFEDVDLCYRAATLGYRIARVEDAQVTHEGGKSLSDNRTRKKYYYASQLYYFKKHLGVIKTVLLYILRWPIVLKNV